MLETVRLFITPLTYEQLLKYSLADHSLEAELGLKESMKSISAELQEALEQTILPNVKNPGNNYLFSTLWTIISKEENKMVGDLCFMGEPNAEGEIEIGYGTYAEFQQKGFMTEAVAAMISWAKEQPGVRAIIASTDKINTASFSVLLKNQFQRSGVTDTMFKWRIDLKKP